MISNEEKKKLFEHANKAIKACSILNDDNSINASYNSQIAAFPVSIAFIGLIPTIRHYNNPDSEASINKSKILELIDSMYLYDNKNDNPQGSVEHLCDLVEKQSDNGIREKIIKYALALKPVIRTYKLVKDE